MLTTTQPRTADRSAIAIAALLAFSSTACGKLIEAMQEQKRARDAGVTSEAPAVDAPSAAALEPQPDTPPEPPPLASVAPRAATTAVKLAPTCAGACEHTLKCLSAFSADDQEACVTECRKNGEDPAKLGAVTNASCATILAHLSGGSAPPPVKPNTQPAPKKQGCSADCHGCYWEQDQCMYVNGYIATGIKQACARCCCPGH